MTQEDDGIAAVNPPHRLTASPHHFPHHTYSTCNQNLLVSVSKSSAE